MTHEEIEEGKANAQWMLERLIPFAEWLGLAPRLPGDVDTYFMFVHMIRHQAATGELPPRGSFGAGRPMAVSKACLEDEECYFRFGPDE
jgi:hypothetical protein